MLAPQSIAVAAIAARAVATDGDASKKRFTWQQVAQHNTSESAWVTISGKVYDITREASAAYVLVEHCDGVTSSLHGGVCDRGAATPAPLIWLQPFSTNTQAGASCCYSQQGASAPTCSPRTTFSKTRLLWRSTSQRMKSVRRLARPSALSPTAGHRRQRYAAPRHSRSLNAQHRSVVTGTATGPTEFPTYAPDTRGFYKTLASRVKEYFDRTGYDSKAPTGGG